MGRALVLPRGTCHELIFCQCGCRLAKLLADGLPCRLSTGHQCRCVGAWVASLPGVLEALQRVAGHVAIAECPDCLGGSIRPGRGGRSCQWITGSGIVGPLVPAPGSRSRFCANRWFPSSHRPLSAKIDRPSRLRWRRRTAFTACDAGQQELPIVIRGGRARLSSDSAFVLRMILASSSAG